MAKKAETPRRKARRKYEEVNKEQRRQATEQFNTRLPRKDYEEICAFLKAHGIRKIDIIYRGYLSFKEEWEEIQKDNK